MTHTPSLRRAMPPVALAAICILVPAVASCNLFMPTAQYTAPRQASAFTLIASGSYDAQDDLRELSLDAAVLDGLSATDAFLEQTTAYVFLRAKDRTMDGLFSLSQSGVSWVQRQHDTQLNPGNLFYQNGIEGFSTIAGSFCIPIKIQNGEAMENGPIDFGLTNLGDGTNTSPVRMLVHYSDPAMPGGFPWRYAAFYNSDLWLDSSVALVDPLGDYDSVYPSAFNTFNDAFSVLTGGGFWNPPAPGILRMGYSSQGSLTWMLFERRDDVQRISERVLAVVDAGNQLGTYRYEPQGTAGRYLVAGTGFDGVRTGFCLIGDSSGQPAHSFSMVGKAIYVGEALCAPFDAGQTAAVFCVLSSTWDAMDKKTSLNLSLWAIPVEELNKL